MFPEGRTGDYIIYRACERWGILPEPINDELSWSKLNVYQQASLIGYEQIRQMEEVKDLEYIALAGIRKKL